MNAGVLFFEPVILAREALWSGVINYLPIVDRSVIMKATKGEMVLKLPITVKVTLFICSVTLVVTGVAFFLGYQWGAGVLSNTLEQNQLNVSALTLRYLAEMFEKKVSLLEGYALSPAWVQALKKANFRNDLDVRQDIQETLLLLDKKWFKEGKNEPLVKDRLEKARTLGLRNLMDIDSDIVEIFLTDKYGGLVACSQKTSDFYQADEAWWQAAFNEGKGDIFVGDFSFDESAGLWSFAIALPVLEESGRVVGVCKAIVDLKRFFSPLNIFRVSQSGEFTLVDKDGTVIYHYGANPFTGLFCSKQDFDKILKSKKRQAIVLSSVIGKKVFVSASDFDYPFLVKQGIDFKILISQDAEEVFSPLKELLLQRTKVFAILLPIMILLGIVSGRAVTRSIRKLHRASLRVAQGDYQVKTALKTHDELEELSGVFDGMVASIKEKQEILKAQADKLSAAQRETLEALRKTREHEKQIAAYAQKLEYTNRELEQFASIVSHDLQEPLRMVAGYLQLLEKRYIGRLDQDADDFIKYAVQGALRMKALIDTILSYSRSGSAQINLQPVDAQQLFDTVLSVLKPSINEYKVSITHDPLPVVIFDMTQLGQLFQNLLSNAIKYRRNDSPKVHISSEKRENEWVFSVRDNGIGIAKKDQERIFQVFQRADTRGTQAGTGLGLAICKKIVERHGGKIWVESELGEGAVFYFTIPIVPRDLA